jgi:dienelactone hydrolase
MSQDWKYVAFVADVYGANGRNITDPSESDTLAAAWRSNATAFAERIQNGVNAAVEAWSIFVNWEGTVERVALAGYGLGGTGALMHAMLGWDTVDAVVAFDPDGLESLPPPAAVVAPKVLVLSGEETDASATIMHLEETLNNANATWEITRLSEVEVGQDGYFRAWVDSHRFFRDTLSYNGSSIFASPYQPGYWEDPSPPETIRVTTTLYTDVDGTELRGYLARPNDAVFASPHPTIIILP